MAGARRGTGVVDPSLPLGTVTFLFTDLEGSTRLLRNLGRADYACVLEGQRSLVRKAAASSQGVVVDSEGDGMLIAFASARAALDAAVAAQRALVSARWGDDVRVRVRMGVDSGEVVVQDGRYVGVALHRGARICQAGRGGQVLLSAVTRALVGSELPDGIEVREVGDVILDGFPEPEQLFQIVADDLPDSSGTPRVRPRQPANHILERESEVTALKAIVADARNGSGSVTVIEGPAGIGKSSLLEMARANAVSGGLAVLDARGGELEVDYPFGVVRQLFEPVVVRDAADGEALFAGAAALARHLFDAAAAPASRDSYAILHGLYWLTVNIAERGPLLLVVDDLQWCDVASLRFLAYLAPRVQDMSLTLLVAVRSGDQPVDERAFAAVTSDVSVRRILPRPLSEEATAELLLGAFAAEPDPAFVRACHTATSANPLLLHELLGALVAAGAKPTADSLAAIPELGADAVSRFVLRRLARLPQAATAVAGATAVLGEQAELATVAQLARLERAVAADAAGALARADVLASGTSLRFVHPLVRDAVYLALAPSEREEAHARAATLFLAEAEPLERRAFSSKEPLTSCALHLLHAAPASVPGAAGLLRDAARLSLAEGAPGSAVGFLQRALAERLVPAERALVLLELGTAELRLDARSAAAHLREAVALLDEPEQRDGAALLLGRALYAAGESLEAVHVLESALQGRPDPKSDLSQRIRAELIGALFESVQGERAAEHMRDIRQLVPDAGLGGRMLRAQLSTQVGTAFSRQETIALASEAVADGLLLEEETSDIFMWATAALMVAGEYGLARSALDRAFERAARRGSMQMFVTASHFRARLFYELGALAEAEADARGALDVLEIHDLPVALPWLASVLGDVLVERGRLEDAEAAVRLAPASERAQEPASLLLTRARLWLALERPAEALLEVDEVRRRFATDSERLRASRPRALRRRGVGWRSLAARVLAARGRPDEALTLAYEEIELARSWGAPRLLGHVLRVTGLLEGGSNGRELLREAVAVLEGSPARLELAHALAALGAATRRAGQRVEARKLLRRALELAELCGADALEAELRSELVATGARPRRAMLTGVDALTPSELRVAQLAADGKSNRAIAQDLFVTLKTVEMHLAGTYRKLGISSRTELPALLGERAVAV